MPTPIDAIRLHPAQHAFRHSAAIYRGFVGGRGSGKSWAGSYDLCRRARPGRLYLVAAPTYRMLSDSSIRTFQEVGSRLRFIRDFSKGEMIATLGNGAQVLFRSTDDPDRLRGPNLSGAWLDEAGDMDEEAYLIAIACLREAGEQGWLSATFTPRGRSHWTFRVFGGERQVGSDDAVEAGGLRNAGQQGADGFGVRFHAGRAVNDDRQSGREGGFGVRDLQCLQDALMFGQPLVFGDARRRREREREA